MSTQTTATDTSPGFFASLFRKTPIEELESVQKAIEEYSMKTRTKSEIVIREAQRIEIRFNKACDASDSRTRSTNAAKRNALAARWINLMDRYERLSKACYDLERMAATVESTVIGMTRVMHLKSANAATDRALRGEFSAKRIEETKSMFADQQEMMKKIDAILNETTSYVDSVAVLKDEDVKSAMEMMTEFYAARAASAAPYAPRAPVSSGTTHKSAVHVDTVNNDDENYDDMLRRRLAQLSECENDAR